MPKRKSSNVVGKLPEAVQLIEQHDTGLMPFDTQTFSADRDYHPIALFWYGFDDGSGELCFSIPDDDGNIRTVSASKFRVVTKNVES